MGTSLLHSAESLWRSGCEIVGEVRVVILAVRLIPVILIQRGEDVIEALAQPSREQNAGSLKKSPNSSTSPSGGLPLFPVHFARETKCLPAFRGPGPYASLSVMHEDRARHLKREGEIA